MQKYAKINKMPFCTPVEYSFKRTPLRVQQQEPYQQHQQQQQQRQQRPRHQQ